ncbi:MAG: T9SS type A sorting domain-containing protein [Pedobacter sp.]|nr:MAG: T9SS type A sorting domain-containing protein [Pedobacter sp.]
MRLKFILLLHLIALCNLYNIYGQVHFPGGVTGAEVWYKANYQELNANTYINSSLSHVRIIPCPQFTATQALYNFNHSITTNQLCLTYDSPLEINTSRNIFFVGEKSLDDIDPVISRSNLTTSWSRNLGETVLADTVTNQFDLATLDSQAARQVASYQSVSSAYINFYNWNIYSIDKRFKSFGYRGETSFNIGKEFENDQVSADYFTGNFPEFISYPFELSADQRVRVESYLALKYGITLSNTVSYRNSKNSIFWNKSNNALFGSRIFGIGRDNLSDLNQLQSESVHYKDYLVASVGIPELTNPIKQETVAIDNNHFIVSGDNNAAYLLDDENDFKVRTLKKKWLSQNTGIHIQDIDMHFKLNITGILETTLKDNPSLRLWMLHDRFVTNEFVSDFNNNYVEYYEAYNVQDVYAFFKNVQFDTDQNVYDQYTFGIGPQLILQVRYPGSCDYKDLSVNVVIKGGTAPYTINITNVTSFYEDYTVNEPTMIFQAPEPGTYEITVTDSSGNTAQMFYDILESPEMLLDLGPDQNLSSSQPEIILNAGIGVQDPMANYSWTFNGSITENYGPTLIVNQPGEYSVKVTASNHYCELTDTIIISYNFTGEVETDFSCDDKDSFITLKLTGGTPPYNTTVTGITNANISLHQVHNNDTYTFNNVEYGDYTVTTVDINGAIFQTDIEVNGALDGIELDLGPQLLAVCQNYPTGPMGPNSYPTYAFCNVQAFTIDASQSVTAPNVSYEWFLDGNTLNINDPIVEVTNGVLLGMYNGVHEYSIRITNLDTGCSTEQYFTLVRTAISRINQSQSFKYGVQGENDFAQSSPSKPTIKTRIYPNPADAGSNFTYEVFSDENFDGTVEVFSTLGSLVYQVPIGGQSSYVLPFNLLASGVYFICTRTNGNVLTDRIIIK